MPQLLETHAGLVQRAYAIEPEARPFSKTVESSERSAERLFAAARILILLTLFFSPLAFGAVEPWAWGIIGLASVCSFMLWGLGNLRRDLLRVTWTPLYSIGILFLLLASAQYFFHLTEDRAVTWEAMLKFATDFLIFFLAGQLWKPWAGRPKNLDPCNRRGVSSADTVSASRGARATGQEHGQGHMAVLGVLVSVYAFSVALFAILQCFSSHGLIYWWVHPRWGGWIFGPYVNHNHFAGLMEMLIPLAAVFALAQSADPSQNVRAHDGGGTLASRVWPLGAMLVGLTSVLLSGSRGGLIALLAEGLIFFAVLAPAHCLPRRHAALAALSIGCAVLLFLWLAPGNVASRLATVAHLPQSPEATLGQREAAARDTLHLFKDHWLTGTGLGSFQTAFTPYLTFASDFVWEHAHNDYLELTAETGIAGSLLALAALVIFLGAVFRRIRAWPGSTDQWIRLGAAVGCMGILVHSLGDFNLHIPANAAWFAMLAGLATAFPLTHRFAAPSPRLRGEGRGEGR